MTSTIIGTLTLIRCSHAENVHVGAAQGFQDCLQYHYASNYACNVTSNEILVLASVSNTKRYADVDSEPYHICIHLLGLRFQAGFDFGFRIYHPNNTLVDISTVNTNDLINAGLIALSLPDMNKYGNTSKSNLLNYLQVVISMGSMNW